MELKNLSPFGVEIENFSVRNATDSDLHVFDEAFRKYSLVLIRDPEITEDEHIRLISRLGDVSAEWEGAEKMSYIEHDPKVKNGADFVKGELSFHYDLAATDDWPYHILSLYGATVTASGGETKFAHGGRAYAQLSETTKAVLDGRRAIHIFDPYAPPSVSRPTEDMMGKFAERGIHDVVRPHPYGNGHGLTVAYQTTERIVGIPRHQSDELINEMYEALYSPNAIYSHKWRVGDLLIWDNRVVQHGRGDFDPSQGRRLRRVVVADDRSIQRRYQRWFEQPSEEDGRKCRPGRIRFPGDPGLWYGKD